jgi:DNA-binding IclR family transcriptional regulator
MRRSVADRLVVGIAVAMAGMPGIRSAALWHCAIGKGMASRAAEQETQQHKDRQTLQQLTHQDQVLWAAALARRRSYGEAKPIRQARSDRR